MNRSKPHPPPLMQAGFASPGYGVIPPSAQFQNPNNPNMNRGNDQARFRSASYSNPTAHSNVEGTASNQLVDRRFIQNQNYIKKKF